MAFAVSSLPVIAQKLNALAWGDLEFHSCVLNRPKGRQIGSFRHLKISPNDGLSGFSWHPRGAKHVGGMSYAVYSNLQTCTSGRRTRQLAGVKVQLGQQSLHQKLDRCLRVECTGVGLGSNDFELTGVLSPSRQDDLGLFHDAAVRRSQGYCSEGSSGQETEAVSSHGEADDARAGTPPPEEDPDSEDDDEGPSSSGRAEEAGDLEEGVLISGEDLSQQIAAILNQPRGYDINDSQFMISVMQFLLSNKIVGHFFDVDGRVINDWPQERVVSIFCSKLGGTLLNEEEMRCNPRRIDWTLDKELRSKVFAGSKFSVVHSEASEYDRVFYGDLAGSPAQAAAELEERLALHYPELTLVLRDDILGMPEVGLQDCMPVCQVSYRDAVLVNSYEMLSIPSILACVYGITQVMYLDPALASGVRAAWAGLQVPLGLLAVLASAAIGQALCCAAYKLPSLPTFYGLPAIGFGAVGILTQPTCRLPNRACSADLALSTVLASGAMSLALMQARGLPLPPLPPLEYFGGVSEAAAAAATAATTSSASASVQDMVLVTAETFGHSKVLTDIAEQWAFSSFVGAEGQSVLALPPLTLAGVLGLNMTMLSLLPYGFLPGGRLFDSIFKKNVLEIVSIGIILQLLGLMISGNKSLWVGYGACVLLFADGRDSQLDMISGPGLVRTALGVAVIAGAFCSLLPKPLFDLFFPGSF